MSALIASLNCRARRAQPSHRKPGAEQLETKAISGIGPSFQHRFAFKFFRTAASHTNQVVMIVIVIGGQLKTLTSFGQLQLAQEVHGCQEPERPIHGGQRNP